MNLSIILKLFEKYKCYNIHYSLLCKCKHKNANYREHPILLDALFSGCDIPFASSSNKYFTDEIFLDIREIIYLIPETINSRLGYLRCRNEITPLFAACINTNIPLYIIEFLLLKGANKHHQIIVNGNKIDILSDLQSNMDIIGDKRFKDIEILFSKY